MDPIRLVGESVILREFALTDVDAVHRIIGDHRVTTWLSFDSRNRAQAEAMIRGALDRAQSPDRVEYYFAVDVANELVGFVRLGLAGVRAAKLGYAIGAKYWGCGYATDAARTAIRFGFGHLNLRRISAAIGPDNRASVAVVKHLGFTYEGRLRDHVFTNGAWRDSLLYSLIAPEWRETQAASSGVEG
ncbi:GNAT family N-acetyltransferase [Actinocatenispora rupis]|uniref:N-acetyltransferase n=1 Tax=Actinocatenispora rupis TaxID=519421 RepID=A0A8J3NGJ0_9ACTN|nr:GNAT family protein [Actinocatenispora rupis]GID14924.1 N-acetyltransferase [Actinocatenispora rupis]